jgi:L-fucose isomerase-like protein
MAAQRTMTYGIVVGNRGFFPDHLAKTGREEMIAAVEAAGAKALVLGPEDSKYGAVETYAEATHCADFSRSTRRRSTASSSRCPTSATSAA